MARSLKKGPYVDSKLLAKLQRLPAGSKTVVKTWARDSVISPEMVGYTVGVHNGKTFVDVHIVEEMVGHRLGEFAPTRKFVKHGGRIQRELEAQAAQAQAAAAQPAGSAQPKKQ